MFGSNQQTVKTLINFNPLLITGGQGSGKTTLVISLVTQYLKQNPEAQFFHHGLDGATFGTAFDDPQKWHELPENAIIYIDEADKNGFQSLKRAESLEALPDYIRAITELRHKGHYLVLSTVSEMDIRHFIREKVRGWANLSRPYGLSYALITLYPGWKSTSKLSGQDKKDWERQRRKLKFKHDKEAQAKFKSSSIHTSTYSAKNLPWFPLLMIIGGIIIAIWLGMRGVNRVTSVAQEEEPSAAPTPAKQPVSYTSVNTAAPPQTQAVRTVYALSIEERIAYSVPDFMTDAHYQLYTYTGGYRCGYAQLGTISKCICNAINTGQRLGLPTAVCMGHIRTHEYPYLPEEVKRS